MPPSLHVDIPAGRFQSSMPPLLHMATAAGRLQSSLPPYYLHTTVSLHPHHASRARYLPAIITPSSHQAYLREPSTQNSVTAKFITQLPQIPLQPALRGLSFASTSISPRHYTYGTPPELHTSTSPCLHTCRASPELHPPYYMDTSATLHEWRADRAVAV